MENNTKNTSQWSSQLGFILSVIGSTIGLGSIWRFPNYSYENFGGTFIIVYLISITIIGIPMFILEFALGHKYKQCPPNVFRRYNLKWAWVGWLSLLIGFSLFGVGIYYTVVLAWCLIYFKHAFTLAWGTDTNDFFVNHMLSQSNSVFDLGLYQIEIIFSLLICWFINWLVLYRGLNNGPEKANKIFMPLLFLITIILFGWGLTLDGAKEGIISYITPNLNEFMNLKVWFNGVNQALFSLSLVIGVMMIYASFLPKKENLVKPALISAYSTAIFAIFFGFIIFSVLGYTSKQTNIPIKDVVAAGPGLAFVTLTKAFNLIAADYSRPVAIFTAILFFFSLVIAGISSLLAIVQCFIFTCVEEFNWKSSRCLNFSCIFGFIFGTILYTHQAGSYWIDIVDNYVVGYLLIVCAILHALLIGWFTPLSTLINHVNQNSNIKIGRLWKFSIQFLCPIFFFIILINTFFSSMQSFEYDILIYWTILIMICFTTLTSFFFQYIFNYRYSRNTRKH